MIPIEPDSPSPSAQETKSHKKGPTHNQNHETLSDRLYGRQTTDLKRAVSHIANLICLRCVGKTMNQALFFNGSRFKLCPVDGCRWHKYLSEELELVAVYSEPDYEMVFSDVWHYLVDLGKVKPEEVLLQQVWIG